MLSCERLHYIDEAWLWATMLNKGLSVIPTPARHKIKPERVKLSRADCFTRTSSAAAAGEKHISTRQHMWPQPQMIKNEPQCALVCTDALCFKTHRGPSATSHKTLFHRKATGQPRHSAGTFSDADMKTLDRTHARPRGCERTGTTVRGSIFTADCDLWASVVGGDALRLHFLPKRGMAAGQRMDWGKKGAVNDRNYTVLRFTM